MLPIYSINFLTKALLGISSSHVYSLGHINMIAKLIQKKPLKQTIYFKYTSGQLF